MRDVSKLRRAGGDGHGGGFVRIRYLIWSPALGVRVIESILLGLCSSP